jgi:hypothetical protein
MEIAELSRSAPRSGRGGRRFKSCHSDQISSISKSLTEFFTEFFTRFGAGDSLEVPRVHI